MSDHSVSPADAAADRLGETLERARLLTPDQARAVEEHRQVHGTRFGESAVELGFIDQRTLDQALSNQFGQYTPDSGWSGEPIAFTDPHSREAEDYRSIRNALTLRWFKHPQGERTLAVISPDRGEGRSRMAANIAVCLAQVGFSTLLIDADMRNPRQHELFNIDASVPGLSSLLSDRITRSPIHAIPSIPTLSVVPVGGIPPNPQELLLRGRLEGFVEEAKQRFDMIVFDTPAAAVGSDYQIVGASARGAMLVTQHARTRTQRAKRLVEQCRGFGIRVVGSAMLGAE